MTQADEENDSRAKYLVLHLADKLKAAKRFRESGQIEQAAREIFQAVNIGEEALATNPDYYDNFLVLNIVARLHTFREKDAPDDIRHKNYDRAIQLLRLACEMEPDDNVAPTLLAGLLISRENFAEALSLLENVYVRENPRSTGVLNHLCSAYIILGRYPEALRTAEEFIAINPQSHLAWEHKAQALLGLHDIEGAEAARCENERLRLLKQARSEVGHAAGAMDRDITRGGGARLT